MYLSAFTELGVVAFLKIPKCGTQSLQSISTGSIGYKQASNIDVKIAFVRDPIERFKSAHMFLSSTHKDVPYNYEDFVDWSFENCGDQHLIPQVEYLGEVSDKRYNRVFKLNDMSKVLYTLTGNHIKPLNVSDRNSHRQSNYRMSCLIERYKKDLEMWYGLR
jgi:hypothetical protein